MEDATTEKFKIRNIDCVNCAVKIEAGLKQLDASRMPPWILPTRCFM